MKAQVTKQKLVRPFTSPSRDHTRLAVIFFNQAELLVSYLLVNGTQQHLITMKR